MASNLVIVESPAKAGTIQKFLGDDYIVKPSFGHIRDLQNKKISIDIENNFEPEYEIPKDKVKIITELKKLAKQADTVWLASDEDREGEAISWHLIEALNLDKSKIKRIVFHEITKSAILKAIENPRPIDMNLVNAQQARRILDRLVGFELSPILWRKIQPKLSAGRVQSVALRLIVDKEREILHFERSPYYYVSAKFLPSNNKTEVKAILDKKFNTIEEAEEFLKDCSNADFSITDLESKEGKRTATAPFTTSTLQQEAARKLRFPVSLTMRVAQQLYEKGLITYMRTDSTNLSSLAINTSKKFIIENFGEEYSKTRQFQTKSKGAQEAHEAIRPTYIENTKIEGSEQEKKLYELIWKRTVASQMADAKILKTTVKLSNNYRSEKFIIQANQVLFDGFLKLYIESNEDSIDEEEVLLPELHIGEGMKMLEINADCKFTSPGARYSEASLVKKLEELGIGRPSTYAPTISTLTTGRGYVIKGDKEGTKVKTSSLQLKDNKISKIDRTEYIGSEKSKLFPEEIGIIVTDYLVKNFETVLNYDFTANVEQDFDKIAEGNSIWQDVISSFYQPFHNKVDEALNDKHYNNVSRELGIDPVSGENIVAKFGQYGPYIQKGEGEKRQFAKLMPGQLIESISLEEALKLFSLPRSIGSLDGIEVIATKGRFGPYLKYGDKNISLPKGADPLSISLEDCKSIIENSNKTSNEPIKVFQDSDIQIINGRYGPYIKHAGANYKLDKNINIDDLSEEKCKEIIDNSQPSKSRYKKKSKKEA